MSATGDQIEGIDRNFQLLSIAEGPLCLLSDHGDTTCVTERSKIRSWESVPEQAAPPRTKEAPSPVEEFITRNDVLEHMGEVFASGRSNEHRVVYVLHGTGGTGKTQLALGFLQSTRDLYKSIFFVDASSELSLSSSFQSIGHWDGQMEGLPAEEAAENVARWLADVEDPWLLILDGADDPELALSNFIPESNNGHVIITTRNPGAKALASPPNAHLDVKAMSAEDSAELLLQLVSEEQRNGENAKATAQEIVEKLAHLPLAFSLAGAFLSSSNEPAFTSYPDLLEEKLSNLAGQSDAQDKSLSPIHAVLEITFDHLELQSFQDDKNVKAAIELLRIVAHFHHTDLTEEMFWRAFQSSPEIDFLATFKDENGNWDSQFFVNVISSLRSYGLVAAIGKGTFSIHPEVHSWTRQRLPERTQEEYWRSALRILDAAIPSSDDEDDAEFQRQVFSHTIPLDFSKVLPENAVAASKFVEVYLRTGLAAEGRSLLVRLVTKVKEYGGMDHPETLTATSNLGLIFSQSGQIESAEALLTQVLMGRTDVFGMKHPDTLASLRNLARVYHAQSRYEETEDLQLKELEGMKDLVGTKHADTLTCMNNLAITYGDLGRYRDAEELQLQLIELSKEVLGDTHPDTLRNMNNLALTYIEQGRYGEAEAIQVKVLEEMKELVGLDHPITMTSMDNLATTYRNQGRYDEAEQLQLQVVEVTKENLGPGHPDTLRSMSNLGTTYYELEQWEKAELYQIRVFETRLETLGINHPDTLTIMSNLALTYRNQGKWEEAEGLQVQELEFTKELLGLEHPTTLTSMNNLALTYNALNQYEAAEELHLQELEVRKNLLGPKHPGTLTTMHNLASNYAVSGRTQEAIEILEEVVPAKKEMLGAGHPSLLASVETLVALYNQEGKKHEAQAIMAEMGVEEDK